MYPLTCKFEKEVTESTVTTLRQNSTKRDRNFAPIASDTFTMLYKIVFVAGVAVASAGSIELCAAHPRPGAGAPETDRRLWHVAGLAPRPAPAVALTTSRAHGARRSRCWGATRRHAAPSNTNLTRARPTRVAPFASLALFTCCRLPPQVSAEYDRNENKDFVSEVSLAGDSGKVKYELTSKLRGKTDFTLATTTSDGTTIEAEGAVEVCPQPHPSPSRHALLNPSAPRPNPFTDEPDFGPAHTHTKCPKPRTRARLFPLWTHGYQYLHTNLRNLPRRAWRRASRTSP